MTEVKPNEEDEKLNPLTGDEVEDEDFDLEDDKDEFEDDEDDDKQESEIDLINKATGKKFTQEQLIQYIKKVDKDYAQKKVTNVVEKPQTDKPVTANVTMSERLLKLEQPASKFVIDEIKRDHPGKDPYAVWEQSEYYRNEASIREAKENAKKRVGNPSDRVGDDGGEKTEAEKMEDKFMDPSKLPPGFKFNKTK
jgi:hypothetical protein